VTGRLIAALWFIVGVAVWNGFFDLYVYRGEFEFRRLHDAYQAGRAPEPDMKDVMARATGNAARYATIWAALVVAAGSGTYWAARRSVRPS
jgi:hypothetical protein